MVQVELPDCNPGIQITRKIYTHEEVNKMIKTWKSSGQVSLKGMAIGTPENQTEEKWIRAAIFDALNKPELYGCKCDTFGALMTLREMIKNKNAKVLSKWYNLPVKYEYRNNYGINAIVDVNNDDEIIFPLIASEILDIIGDLNKNRKIKEIYDNYEFYHKTVNIECLEKFKVAYKKGALNKLIKYICTKSNKIGGFHDYGINVIRNRITSQYLYDSRKLRVRE